MGYYTAYELDVIKNETGINKWDIIEHCVKETKAYEYALEVDGSTYDTVKWYSALDEVKEFSKKYPECVFLLSGKGKEAGDIWRAYFKNGKKMASKSTDCF